MNLIPNGDRHAAVRCGAEYFVASFVPEGAVGGDVVQAGVTLKVGGFKGSAQ